MKNKNARYHLEICPIMFALLFLPYYVCPTYNHYKKYPIILALPLLKYALSLPKFALFFLKFALLFLKFALFF